MDDLDEPAPPGGVLQPWTVTSSERLVDDRWLRLRADHCLTAEGVEIAPYYVFDYPDWVQVVALDDEDHILLVEQYRHGLGGLSLELPAGSVDAGDSDAVAAAVRELEEETGYGSGAWRHIARLAPNTASHSNHCHVVLATGVRPVRAPCDDPTERLRLVRLPVQQAVRAAFDGGMIQTMHIASLALALTPLGLWRP